MFFGVSKGQLALDRIDAHMKDCADERAREKEFRQEMLKQQKEHHVQNQSSIKGIYALLWSIAGTAFMGILGGFIWALVNMVTWRVPVQL